jgi:hypothetical protein
VEDVIRGMESYAQTIEPEVQRRVEGVNQMANHMLETEIAKQRQKSRATRKLANRLISEEKKRTQFHKGRAAASRRANSRWTEVANKLKRPPQRSHMSHEEAVSQFKRDVLAELARGAS